MLIRMRASVICGSELHDYHSAHAGKGIAGHEGVGEVVSTPVTSGLAEGQLVAVQVLSGCGNCEHCLAGDPEHCTTMRFHGGTHAEFMAVPAICCPPVPADIPPDIAVLLGGDAIGTPYHALSRLGVNAADTTASLRLWADRIRMHGGAAGLRSRAFSPSNRSPIAANWRISWARRIRSIPRQRTAVACIRDLTGDRGASVTLDCSPEAETVTLALESAAIHAQCRAYRRETGRQHPPRPTVHPQGTDGIRLMVLHRAGLLPHSRPLPPRARSIGPGQASLPTGGRGSSLCDVCLAPVGQGTADARITKKGSCDSPGPIGMEQATAPSDRGG